MDTVELNQWLFNTDTVNKVLEVLMTRGHKVAGGDGHNGELDRPT
jgi:type I restriction enzyme R subunit